MVDDMKDGEDRADRVGRALATYFEALDAGQTPDREALLREHPDLAEDLVEYFARHDRFEHLVEPLRSAVQVAPSGAPTQTSAGADAEYGTPSPDLLEPTQSGTGTTL